MLSTKEAMLPELFDLTRKRKREQKLRIGIEQTVLAMVKRELGYGTWLEEKERTAIARRAANIVKTARGKCDAAEINKSDRIVLEEIGEPIAKHYELAAFHDLRINDLNVWIVDIIDRLPISDWINAKEQRGLASLTVASILGETGDLCLYDSPAKVFKRMGCAPYQGKAGSTHRREKKLNADQWTNLGYSPRRRSIMYCAAQWLIMGNRIKEKGENGKTTKDSPVIWCGPYRARYDEARSLAKISHPDWKDCHLHTHGNLLCGKRLLRELWREWRRVFSGVGQGFVQRLCL